MLPKLVLGHNALIGVHHSDKSKDVLKNRITKVEIDLIKAISDLGIEAIVLDNHPIAISAAKYINKYHNSDLQIIPMVPYAQSVVDKASRSGIAAIIDEILKSTITIGFRQLSLIIFNLLSSNLTAAGSRMALWNYLSPFPNRQPKICFLHNVVTDLMIGWNNSLGLSSFAEACRSRGIIPGFVTLNPGSLNYLASVVGFQSWFMTSVNSSGIQMSPSQSYVEEEILSNPNLNILGMSILGGGLLDPEVEIHRALNFPAVKSVIIGSRNIIHIKQIKKIVDNKIY